MADATTVATCRRNSVTETRSLMNVRLVSRMTAVCEGGSIQIEVPVKPVWPYAFGDM